ncbi:hypothetical protein E2562_028410 [Oryza meyeriana var. granulata]|uniref:Uncharacterized protein n=1 Tax=Oryza meyeriana var. granulata TaxID=110450 RepID=A0A6G1EQJ4_9ORYZ|nr:hypothetical protein E2562_028410 [Oryza meyeriana var. granulata]KAF0926923.1 hypothetical protein E2562_028410 [Oryza meyeriana var. granulata]
MEKQKPAPDAPLLLALRCSRASLLLSSLRQPRAAPRATTPQSSSAAASELRDAGLLSTELAEARREAKRNAVTSGAEVLLVLSLVPVLLLLGFLTAAAVAA